MFTPPELTLVPPYMTDLPSYGSNGALSPLELTGGMPDFKELPEAASRIPIEIWYECHKKDFKILKVDPCEIVKGDRIWASEGWLQSMPPDVILATEAPTANGLYRFKAVTTAGADVRTINFTVPAGLEVFKLQWPQYRLVKRGDATAETVNQTIGPLTNYAYSNNGLCYYAHLSPYQRMKIFGCGLFTTMVRSTAPVRIPRAAG